MKSDQETALTLHFSANKKATFRSLFLFYIDLNLPGRQWEKRLLNLY
ncbi:hypothetical protein HNW13_010330 [Shewanella sp. BF02_Schw]|nr:hypothetical protein [Shewanella sp. BF02_Schw]MBO1896165.1 hypothetical protein [Shewanella sp. BF02_Schw]